MRRTLLAVTLALAATVSGCATAGPAQPVPSTPAGSVPSVSQPPPDRLTQPPTGAEPTPTIPVRPPPSGPPKEPTDLVKPVTVRGTIRVTGTCRELVTDTMIWVLLGQPAEAHANGAAVEVTGTPAPNLESPCGGSPLKVQSVRSR